MLPGDELDLATGQLRRSAIRPGTGVTPDTVCLRVDLRGFRRVNDLDGFAISQAVLVEAARRLLTVAEPWPVYRVGGDEFLVVARLPDGAALLDLAERIRDSLTQPHRGHTVGTTIVAVRSFPGATLRRLEAVTLAADSVSRATGAVGLLVMRYNPSRPPSIWVLPWSRADER